MGIIDRSRKLSAGHRLLGAVQNRMEKALFEHAQLVDPDLLIKRGWKFPEHVELQQWEFIRKQACNCQYIDFFPRADPLNSNSWEMRRMRNVAAHRSEVSRWDIVRYLKHSIMFAILMGDRVQAVEIEILGERWLTSSSRHEVLERLRDVFLVVEEVATDGASKCVPAKDTSEANSVEGGVKDESLANGTITDTLSEDTLEKISAEAAEIEKCHRERERKRRYAVAKVLIASWADAKPRSRCLPRYSALRSLILNLPIPEHDNDLIKGDSSIVEQNLAEEETINNEDASTYQNLVKAWKKCESLQEPVNAGDWTYGRSCWDPVSNNLGHLDSQGNWLKQEICVNGEGSTAKVEEEGCEESWEEGCDKSWEEGYEEYSEEEYEDNGEEYEDNGEEYEDNGEEYEAEEIEEKAIVDEEKAAAEEEAAAAEEEGEGEGGEREREREREGEGEGEGGEGEEEASPPQNPFAETPNNDQDQHQPTSNETQQEAVNQPDAVIQQKPMFWHYTPQYEQMLSTSMHDVYKLTEAEMRALGWEQLWE